ncbi:hypothetical protein NHP164001_08700 [Helicobacter trogontum]|uniref:Uncharacterized protein n=1 Tax=Helicobacter trogontum TaxID=50960 RepID=A0ABQ0D3U8_9HELI
MQYKYLGDYSSIKFCKDCFIELRFLYKFREVLKRIKPYLQTKTLSIWLNMVYVV